MLWPDASVTQVCPPDCTPAQSLETLAEIVTEESREVEETTVIILYLFFFPLFRGVIIPPIKRFENLIFHR